MNSIYLGDIDPNNNIISPMEIRRSFMYQLLIWDSIVLSDSQFLTDPRIHLMMAGFNSKNFAEKWGMPNIDKFHKDFEQLVNNGFVEVACREDNREKFTLRQLYDEMSHRTSKVPYLPEEEDYPAYLDSLNFKERVYDLDSIANRFRTNLILGVGTESFPNTTYIENEVSALFYEDKVYFSTIHGLLKENLRNGNIDKAEYINIYDYVYSCYSINISAETDCYLNTAFKNIPLHLGCGTGDFTEAVGQAELDNMRPTWALNPEILDHISLEDFVALKKELAGFLDNGVIMEYFNGQQLTKDKLDLFYDIWDKYTKYLEKAMKELLQRNKLQIVEELLKMSDIKIKQKTFLSDGWKMVESWLGCVVPAVGATSASVETVKHLRNLSYRPQWNNLIERYHEISRLLPPDARIITKY